MNEALYHKALLRLAAEAHGAGRLADAQARAQLDNPLCGDRVAIEISVNDGKIMALAHEAKACLLCQASASLIGREALGKTEAEITTQAAAIEAFLKRNQKLPDDAWTEFAFFAPVAAHKSRHRCVLLPFEALAKALRSLQ